MLYENNKIITSFYYKNNNKIAVSLLFIKLKRLFLPSDFMYNIIQNRN